MLGCAGLHSKVSNPPRVLLDQNAVYYRPWRDACDEEGREPRVVAVKMVVVRFVVVRVAMAMTVLRNSRSRTCVEHDGTNERSTGEMRRKLPKRRGREMLPELNSLDKQGSQEKTVKLATA